MEPKAKKFSPDTNKEFQLNLRALDGYDLPTDIKEDDGDQPKAKKSKESRPEILGLDYREREEKRLEQLLFGELLNKFEQDGEVETESQSGTAISRKKHKPKNITSTSEPTKEGNVLPEDLFGSRLGVSTTLGRQAAWIDEDDEIKLKDVKTYGIKATSETVYKKYLEKNFATIHGQSTPKWAQLQLKENLNKTTGKEKGNEQSDDGQSLTRIATDLLSKKSLNLGQTIIEITKLNDINKETRAEGNIIKSIEFHKKQNAALVAGDSCVVSLFQIGGLSNAKIQSITFERFPVYKARFSADGEEVIASSYMSGIIQVHNLTTGKTTTIPHNKQMENGFYKNFVLSPDGKLIAFQGRFGYIHLMSARSKEWLTSLKTNGEVHALTFNADGTRLYSHGALGEVYVWDMKSRLCVHKFVDDGCIKGTAIAISSTQQYLACGSSSGVVNIYDTSKLENNSLPEPAKVILNLTTAISGINFHPSTELMSVFSEGKENALRLVHFPSMTVFKNFPGDLKGNTRFASIDFSPNGGYMAAGVNRKIAQLYRLHHYEQY